VASDAVEPLEEFERIFGPETGYEPKELQVENVKLMVVEAKEKISTLNK